MFTSILSLALLAALGARAAVLPDTSVNTLFARQVVGVPFDTSAPGQPKAVAKTPLSTKDIAPQLEKSAIRKLIRWGPYQLGAANSTRTAKSFDPSGDYFQGPLDGFPRDAMFLSGEAYLTYEDGSRADIATGVYNHHVSLMEIGKTTKLPFACDFVKSTPSLSGMGGKGGHGHGGESSTSAPKLPPTIELMNMLEKNMPESWKDAVRNPAPKAMSQFFGSGDDGLPIVYGSKDPSLKAGYYLGPENQVVHSSEFINYRNYSQTVYITSEVEYLPGKPEGFLDALMGTVSALGCGIAYLPPQNEKHVAVSPPYNVTAPGILYNLRGHLHDGGINVRLHVNGQLVCESKAIYGGEKGTTTIGGEKWETIQDYTHCPKAIPLKVGDQLVVDSEYDLRAHRLRPSTANQNMGGEAMGLMAYSWAAGRPT